MTIYVIFLAAFVAVLVAADTLVRFLRDRLATHSYVNQRIRLIEQNADRTVVYKQLLKERGLNAESQQSFSNFLTRIYIQSGLKVSVTRLFVMGTGLCIGLFVVFSYAELPLSLRLVLTLVVASAIAYFVLNKIRERRVRTFTTQLPDAIDVIVRSLSAGHPLPISLSLVAREMSDPIGTEFGIVSDELTYGTDVDTAIRNMSARVGAEELNLLAISLSVQKGSGGNLGEILANLADMVRKRTMMRAKIKAISAEGRMTSWFMLSFPFFLYGIIRLLHSTYFDPLWESGYSTHFLVVAGCLLTFGMIIIRKIVNFDY